jgi:phenylacetate-coenzyme A ligase PaaK-like adenylate-forming protein
MRFVEQAIKQFRRAAVAVPFYRRLLSKRGLRTSRVTSLESFQTLVPIISKGDVFTSHPLADLLINHSLENIDTLISSSGATAQGLSLGMITRREMRSTIRSTDRLLDDWFDVGRKKTFLINTCAMGLKIPTSLPCIDLSVRSDRAIAIIEKLKTYFQQFVVISDVFFLKKLLEDGRAAGTGWAQRQAHFVIGGEWFPESYRRYLAHVLQVDLNHRHPPLYILASMGAAELGFNLCHETHDTVRLRQLAESDARLRQALFGCVDTVPLIGHYDPRRWYIELTPRAGLGGSAGALAFTNLDLRTAMPLIRYETGDYGYLFSHAHLSQVLRQFNYETYVPSVTRPLMAVAGRIDQSLTAAGKSVRVEFLRSMLYSDRAVASETTGQFQVTTAGDKLRVQVQMRSQADTDRIAAVQQRLSRLINQHFSTDVDMVPYFEFRHGMGVDYERKFSHLVR